MYYLKHANNFKEDQRLVNLGLSIIRKCPLIKVKSEVLTYILKLKSKKIKKREIYYECGLLHYFQGRWLKALKFFSLSNRLLANYYMGECELKLGHFKDATYYFKQYLKKHNIKPTNNSLVLWVKYRLAAVSYTHL
ncbi:MAG: hypothetical protein MPK62_14790, partial [Alphaproteobacteria bacterium]|nr:hypothetical protein [Alphaproteobacteria bacterium]